jgi:hypothetical protein
MKSNQSGGGSILEWTRVSSKSKTIILFGEISGGRCAGSMLSNTRDFPTLVSDSGCSSSEILGMILWPLWWRFGLRGGDSGQLREELDEAAMARE